jgi:hypothetical protein
MVVLVMMMMVFTDFLLDLIMIVFVVMVVVVGRGNRDGEPAVEVSELGPGLIGAATGFTHHAPRIL